MEVHVPQGKGLFLAWFSAFCKNFVQYLTMATYRYIDVVKNRQCFRTHGIPLNSASKSLSCDIVRFKIELGLKRNSSAKMYQNKPRHGHYATGDARPPCFGIDLDCAVNMLGLCDHSNLLLVISAEERRAVIKLL